MKVTLFCKEKSDCPSIPTLGTYTNDWFDLQNETIFSDLNPIYLYVSGSKSVSSENCFNLPDNTKMQQKFSAESAHSTYYTDTIKVLASGCFNRLRRWYRSGKHEYRIHTMLVQYKYSAFYLYYTVMKVKKRMMSLTPQSIYKQLAFVCLLRRVTHSKLPKRTITMHTN